MVCWLAREGAIKISSVRIGGRKLPVALRLLRQDPPAASRARAPFLESVSDRANDERGRAQARRMGRKCAPWYSEELPGLQPGPFASFLLAFWLPVARDLALHRGCEQCDA